MRDDANDEDSDDDNDDDNSDNDGNGIEDSEDDVGGSGRGHNDDDEDTLSRFVYMTGWHTEYASSSSIEQRARAEVGVYIERVFTLVVCM